MPKFQFRLQQFLGVKEQIENQKEMEYGKALQKLEEEKQKLKNLHDTLLDGIRVLQKTVEKAIPLHDIRVLNNNIDRYKQQIIVQDERVRAAEVFVEEKRQELVQAMKERKALDIVKENAMNEFLKEEDIKERKLVDEIVSFKYTDKLQEKEGK